MALDNVFIPFRGYWSTPFCRWQGQLAEQHAMKLAASTAAGFLSDRAIDPAALDTVSLGITVHQKSSFYGAPWLAAMLGAPHLTGPTIAQACATSVRLLASAALEVEVGASKANLAVACDRTSNGPHVYYPNPKGPGGMGQHHDPVMDNFNRDPWGGTAMVQTAENVAAAEGITREEQDAVALMRYAQYADSLADDRAFQRRWMRPIELKSRRSTKVIAEDEGIFDSSAEGLAKLRPMLPEGTVTFGSQTHPADGNAGMVLCSEEQAKAWSADPAVRIRIRGYGSARVDKAMMPKAVVPAAQAALDHAGVSLSQCVAIKTHNPFAINDVYFCKQTGLKPEQLNRYGSPLVYGHPQAPTGLRAIIELIEELVERGGGLGLFTGCAAGDAAMGMVVEVG